MSDLEARAERKARRAAEGSSGDSGPREEKEKRSKEESDEKRERRERREKEASGDVDGEKSGRDKSEKRKETEEERAARKERERTDRKGSSGEKDSRRRDKDDKRQMLMASVRMEAQQDELLNKEIERELKSKRERERKEREEEERRRQDASAKKPEVEATRLAASSELLSLLSDVKMKIKDKLGGVDFPIPKFVIIGKQSVGKSRLIEALAGEQFNFVSGTLGSRRPTVLEFFNSPQLTQSKWYVRNKAGQWEYHPVKRVMEILGESHESLGANVSSEEVFVRIESPNCVDMEVVDLPGFRDFSIDESKQQLADKIKDLDYGFMRDPRNTLICVEEAGDAANMSSLQKCREFDPHFKRTILVRNKLDKYYKDLTYENVNAWLDGFGDLPAGLTKFALTLPHWQDKDREGNYVGPPMPFSQLRDRMAEDDVREVKAKGASDKFAPWIGFAHFASFMERRIEELFAAAVGPIVKKLKELDVEQKNKAEGVAAEMADTNPDTVSQTIRECGTSFAHALTHVMEGFVSSAAGRCTLEEELQDFHLYLTTERQDFNESEFELFPCPELSTVEEYCGFLRDVVRVPGMDLPLNGGAMYRRLVMEAEVFLRFAEIDQESLPADVVQARGVVTVGQVNWRDVIVKLLSSVAHHPTKRRVRYIAERIRYFFYRQKEAIEDFMRQVKGSSDEQMYSGLFSKHARMMLQNELIKQLVFDTYDRAVDRQLKVFLDLFASTMTSTFSNPWTFLKKSSSLQGEMEDGESSDPSSWSVLPTHEQTAARIPWEIDSRGAAETRIQNWLLQVPTDPNYVDDAVVKVQGLVNKTFSYIRAQLADQMELYGDAFFKVPMMRRLEEDMSEINIDDLDKETYRSRRTMLKVELANLEEASTATKECLDKLNTFILKTRGRIV